jgi:tRNA (guanine9-N1)-methyltransferase
MSVNLEETREDAFRIKRRAKRREFRQRRAQRRGEILSLPESDARRVELTRRLQFRSRESVVTRGTCVMDCQWDALMKESDISHLLKQVNISYGANRSSELPFALHLTSYGGALQQCVDARSLLLKCTGIHANSYLDVFADRRASIVYLTAESPNVLTAISENDIYVIGALVDHNTRKGICHEHALKAGVRTARLPIEEHLSIRTRRVITVNQGQALVCVCH